MDQVTPLLELYKENRAHGRHHDTQRQLVTAAVVGLAAALVSAICALRFHPATVLLGGVIIIDGILGREFSRKFYERFQRHWALARALEERIDNLCPEAGIKACLESADNEHIAKYESKSVEDLRQQLHELWARLNSIVVVLGVVCTLATLLNWAWYAHSGQYWIPPAK